MGRLQELVDEGKAWIKGFTIYYHFFQNLKHVISNWIFEDVLKNIYFNDIDVQERIERSKYFKYKEIEGDEHY